MFAIKDLFELGFHYGHRKWRSNPKMKQFVFCEKLGGYVIDLCQTVPMFHAALNTLRNCSAKGGKILFVGTKHQAKDLIQVAAESCDQFFVNKRWLGGTLTNKTTIDSSIMKLKELERQEEGGYVEKLSKHERLKFQKDKEKMVKSLGGLKKLKGVPDMLVVVDPNVGRTAVSEAKLMGIPVVALADTDTPDPDSIEYLVPGNDEGKASIQFFLDQCVQAIKEGMEIFASRKNAKESNRDE